MKKETHYQTKANSENKKIENHSKFKGNREFKKERLKMTVENFGIEQSDFLGNETHTEFALKDPSSYFIYTHCEGGDLIENGTFVSCQVSPIEFNVGCLLCDLIYVKGSDSYLLLSEKYLYRKGIDDEPLDLLMEFKPSVEEGSCLKYSELNQKLILSDSGGPLYLIDLERMKVEFQTNRKTKASIAKFTLFGEKENQLVSLTTGGSILVHTVN